MEGRRREGGGKMKGRRREDGGKVEGRWREGGGKEVDYYTKSYFISISVQYFRGSFNETIIPLGFVRYEMIIGHSVLQALLVIYYSCICCS